MYVHAFKRGREEWFFNGEQASNTSQPLASTSLAQPVSDALGGTSSMARTCWQNRTKEQLKRSRTRRGGVKHRFDKEFNFTIMGNNVASLPRKKDSLHAVIDILDKPSCITLQETKLGEKVRFQINNYQVFHKNRNSSGGGILTAVDPSLHPTLATTDNHEAEILTVQVEIGRNCLRVIN